MVAPLSGGEQRLTCWGDDNAPQGGPGVPPGDSLETFFSKKSHPGWRGGAPSPWGLWGRIAPTSESAEGQRPSHQRRGHGPRSERKRGATGASPRGPCALRRLNDFNTKRSTVLAVGSLCLDRREPRLNAGKHPAVVYFAVEAAAGDAPLDVLSRRVGWGEDHLQLH